MTILGCLLSFVVLVQLSHVAFSCGPAHPCSWTTCRVEWRNDWRPQLPQGRCVNQHRIGRIITIRHQGSGSCPASQSCYPETQRRRQCSCRYAFYCPFNNWTPWTGNIPNGTCQRQSRFRDYNEHVRYNIRPISCNGIQSTCGNRQNDYRTFCSCRYAQCNLGPWSSWTDLPKPVSNQNCTSQSRRRSYTLTWAYVSRSNCNGVQPQQCPGPQEETREKENC